MGWSQPAPCLGLGTGTGSKLVGRQNGMGAKAVIASRASPLRPGSPRGTESTRPSPDLPFPTAVSSSFNTLAAHQPDAPIHLWKLVALGHAALGLDPSVLTLRPFRSPPPSSADFYSEPVLRLNASLRGV